MGPRGQLTFAEQLTDKKLYEDNRRRRKGIKMLNTCDVKEFLLYVVTKNVPLSDTICRKHSIRSKKYLQRTEFYNTSLLVKAILEDVPTSKIVELINYAKIHKINGLLPNDNDNYSPFIKIKEVVVIDPSTNSLVGAQGIRGMRGAIGPGDDGYGYSYCGSPPGYRQFLHDPISFIQSLFIHYDKELPKLVLDIVPEYKKYLTRAFEIFLICDDIREVKKMYEYDSSFIPAYSYDFSKKYLKNNYSFIDNKEINENKYEYDEALKNIWA